MIITLGIFAFWVLPAGILLWVSLTFYMEYRSDRIPILLYHRFISKKAAQDGLVPDDEIIYVSYDTVFAEQMKYLHQAGYTTLNLDDYLEIRAGKKSIPSKSIVITMDDGYLSNYTMAFPSLKKYNQKAVIFVAIKPNEYTIGEVEGMDGFVNEDQIREMTKNNISIQSHTLTHCQLTDLDDAQAEYELIESKHRLENITNCSVEHIAIPRSSYNRRILKLVKASGYKTACCNNKGSSSGLSNPLALPRIVIERDMSIDDFARSLKPKTSAILRLIGNIKRIPEFIGGHKCAKMVRNVLYKGLLKKAFETKNFKIIIASFGVLYIAIITIFTWYLVSSWLSAGGN